MNIKIYKDGYKELLLRCECNGLTHIMSMGYFTGDLDEELYVHVSLDPDFSFIRRIWIGIKYIFGVRTRWSYTELVLVEKDAKEIKTFLENFIKENEDKK